MEVRMEEILSFDSLEIGYTSGKNRKVLLPALKAFAAKGELVAVIGKNGIGKSTLLRTIAGLQPAIAGILQIGNRNIEDYSRLQLSAKVGYISTEIIKVSNMKVYDLVSLGRFPHTNWFGTIDQSNHDAVMDALTKAGMTGFMDRQITELSDGERQRAMIAMVLAQDAAIMVMDEPTAFLDISSKYEVIHLMRNLTQWGNKTIIYSTHDFNTAVSQADKVWFITEEGLLEGAPEDIMIRGSFKTLFDESKVIFNSHDGSFSIRNEFRGKVNIRGEGEKKYWTEKALTRTGYLVSGSSSPISVETPSASNVRWKCSMPGKSGEFETIYDLVSWIRDEIIF